MRAAATIAVAGASLVMTLAASAAGIVGTDRGETIRGTPGPDRLFGRGGPDTLVGGGGRDVVDGGAGNDRLLLRDGFRDVAICGPGRDVVVADGLDVVYGDCELLRLSPPEPPAPPPRPIVPGVYGGRTTQGEPLTFQVTTGGELSRLVLPAVHLSCSDRTALTTSHDFGAATTVVRRDGTFAMEQSGASYRVSVSGLLTVGIATGAIEVDVEIPDGTCASPGLRWTAAAATLTGP